MLLATDISTCAAGRAQVRRNAQSTHWCIHIMWCTFLLTTLSYPAQSSSCVVVEMMDYERNECYVERGIRVEVFVLFPVLKETNTLVHEKKARHFFVLRFLLCRRCLLKRCKCAHTRLRSCEHRSLIIARNKKKFDSHFPPTTHHQLRRAEGFTPYELATWASLVCFSMFGARPT